MHKYKTEAYLNTAIPIVHCKTCTNAGAVELEHLIWSTPLVVCLMGMLFQVDSYLACYSHLHHICC